jgi:hypothetical protein
MHEKKPMTSKRSGDELPYYPGRGVMEPAMNEQLLLMKLLKLLDDTTSCSRLWDPSKRVSHDDVHKKG